MLKPNKNTKTQLKTKAWKGKGMIHVILLPQRGSERQGPVQRPAYKDEDIGKDKPKHTGKRKENNVNKHKNIDENVDINNRNERDG